MKNLRKLLLSLGAIVVATVLPGQAAADIWVTITDGVTHHRPNNWQPGFAKPVPGTQGMTDTVPLLPTGANCSNRPCKPPFGSAFEFRDACRRILTEANLGYCPTGTATMNSAGIARIIKFENGANQKIELKGLLATAAKTPNNPPQTLAVSFGTEKEKDFKPVGPANLAWAVVLGGAFTQFPPQRPIFGGGRASDSCIRIATNPTMNKPCARLQLKITGQQVGSVTIPCSNASGSPVPCGGSSPYDEYNGKFIAIVEGLFPLAEEMVPYMQVDLDVIFTKDRQSFASIASAVTALSRVPADDFGVESLFHELVDELGADYWVRYSPLSNRFFFQKETVLTSLWKGGSPPLERAKFSRSYASFIADPLRQRWGDLKRLELGYEVVVGNPLPSEELGDLTFLDCAKGSFYLLVKLVSADGKETRDLKVYMGSPEKNFLADCAAAEANLSGFNLIDNDDYRVDGNMTIQQSQQKYKDLYLRSISVVVESESSAANYRVRLYSARVGNSIGFAALPSARREPVDLARADDASRGTR